MFLLAQLSDPHIGATWAGEASVEGLAAAVDAVRELRPQPDAVLMTTGARSPSRRRAVRNAGSAVSLGVPP